VLGKKAPLHDEGLPVRTWLFAGDTANAIITIIEAGVTNEIYNIAGNYEEQNIVVAKKIIDSLRTHQGWVQPYDEFLDLSVKRQGQDVRYAIDDSKLKSLGWKPKANFDTELAKIVEYYKNNFVW
jgi:dTDP-D-glucose 4,6-dehydratase